MSIKPKHERHPKHLLPGLVCWCFYLSVRPFERNAFTNDHAEHQALVFELRCSSFRLVVPAAVESLRDAVRWKQSGLPCLPVSSNLLDKPATSQKHTNKESQIWTEPPKTKPKRKQQLKKLNQNYTHKNNQIAKDNNMQNNTRL